MEVDKNSGKNVNDQSFVAESSVRRFARYARPASKQERESDARLLKLHVISAILRENA